MARATAAALRDGLRRDPLNTLLVAHRDYGDAVRFAFGPPGARTVFYAVFHPDDVQRVLQAHADDFRKENVFYEEIRWAAAVHPPSHRRHAATMAAETEQVIAALRPLAAAGATVDLDAAMTALTLQIVGRILFGSDTHHVLPAVRSAFAVLGEHARRRSFSPLAPPRAWPNPRHRRAVAARRAMHSAYQELIDARRRTGITGDDLVGRLLAAHDDDHALTDAEVRVQVLIFLLARHDTAAIALMMALDLLARHGGRAGHEHHASPQPIVHSDTSLQGTLAPANCWVTRLLAGRAAR